MYGTIKVGVIIPALNEEAAIGHVLRALPACVDDVVVVDNGSTDCTAHVARSLGARVVSEARRGYGQACLTGMHALGWSTSWCLWTPTPAITPEELVSLLQPIAGGVADLVIGSRVRGTCAPGALTPQQRFGNWLACHLIRVLFRYAFSDLGPFRAIRRSALEQLQMNDRDFGWTVQMQVRAVKQRLRVVEVPVSYRCRIGRSKISGTIRGVLGAASKILCTIFKESSPPVYKVRQEWLLAFARYPQPRLTKTRLIDALGAEGAATLQHRMTLGLLQQAKCLRDRRGTPIVVHFTGGDLPLMQSQYGNDMLYPLDDVDRPEDLVHRRNHFGSHGPCISIVIPTLNEQEHIGRAIRSAITADDADVEIIVVDGNSSDETVNIARSSGATVLHGGRGRARQMNIERQPHEAKYCSSYMPTRSFRRITCGGSAMRWLRPARWRAPFAWRSRPRLSQCACTRRRPNVGPEYSKCPTAIKQSSSHE